MRNSPPCMVDQDPSAQPFGEERVVCTCANRSILNAAGLSPTRRRETTDARGAGMRNPLARRKTKGVDWRSDYCRGYCVHCGAPLGGLLRPPQAYSTARNGIQSTARDGFTSVSRTLGVAFDGRLLFVDLC